MAAHRSQFVWYRRLSVIFSRYTYINDLRRMTIDAHPCDGDDSDGVVIDDDDDDAIASLPPVVVVEEGDASPGFLLTPAQIDAVRDAVLPPTLYHRRWRRIYSLARDGDSFVVFRKLMEEWYSRGAGHRSSLLVVRTASGDVIGGYSDVPIVSLASSAGASAARSCLFRLNDETTDVAVDVYGKNCGTSSKRMVFDATRRIIAFGGSDVDDDGVCGSDDGFGLCLNDGFTRGTTARCSAYRSEALVSDRGGIFDVLDVEVWGFVFGQI